MDDSGVLSNLIILDSTLLALGPLNHLENQRLERKGSNQFQELDLWIPSDITIP